MVVILGIPSCTTLLLERCPFLREDVAVKGWVLLLCCESCLVNSQLYWVFQAGSGVSYTSCELDSCCRFRCAHRGRASAIDGGVVAFAGFAVGKAYFVLFTDASVDLVHRERVFYFCHMCSAIEHASKTTKGTI